MADPTIGTDMVAALYAERPAYMGGTRERVEGLEVKTLRTFGEYKLDSTDFEARHHVEKKFDNWPWSLDEPAVSHEGYLASKRETFKKALSGLDPRDIVAIEKRVQDGANAVSPPLSGEDVSSLRFSTALTYAMESVDKSLSEGKAPPDESLRQFMIAGVQYCDAAARVYPNVPDNAGYSKMFFPPASEQATRQ